MQIATECFVEIKKPWCIESEFTYRDTPNQHTPNAIVLRPLCLWSVLYNIFLRTGIYNHPPPAPCGCCQFRTVGASASQTLAIHRAALHINWYKWNIYERLYIAISGLIIRIIVFSSRISPIITLLPPGNNGSSLLGGHPRGVSRTLPNH